MKSGVFSQKIYKEEGYYYEQSYTESYEFVVPKWTTSIEVFAVGGGGGGGGSDSTKGHGGNGGNGGQVIFKKISVTPGEIIFIDIGAGGRCQKAGGYDFGGDTRFGDYVTALGGRGGDCFGRVNDVEPNQTRGGTGSPFNDLAENGEDGVVCPFFPYNKTVKYGGSGAGASMTANIMRYGGATGGGMAGYRFDTTPVKDGLDYITGRDATFYGCGGGGGCLWGEVNGGKGFQGFIRIFYTTY